MALSKIDKILSLASRIIGTVYGYSAAIFSKTARNDLFSGLPFTIAGRSKENERKRLATELEKILSENRAGKKRIEELKERLS